MLFDSHAPRYLPHLQQPGMLAMGLSRIEASAWIETDDAIGEFYRHKAALGAENFSGVYADAGNSEAAQEELARLMESHLLRDHSNFYVREGHAIRCIPGEFCVLTDQTPKLWQTSLLVADDLVLMQPRDGVYHLTAASLCSPSHWRLAEKIGRPMREIHDPIPGIHDDLSGRIDRFFDHLRPELPVQRFNWSLQRNDGLFCPRRDARESGELYYRVERQTLRRLPLSAAIVFTIRVYRHPLRLLPASALAMLRRAIADAPADIAAYKGFPDFIDPLETLCAERGVMA
jgi:hypothetical protein